MSQEVAKNLNPMEEFQSRVLEKLKTDIGALMPDEALKSLVNKAVDGLFFQPTKVKERVGYQEQWVDGPSWFQTEVSRQIGPLLKAEVAEQVATQAETIKEIVLDAVERDRLMLLVALSTADAVRTVMHGSLATLAAQVDAAMQSNMRMPKYG